MIIANASDLHISSGVAPMMRMDNELKVIAGLEALDETVVQNMIKEILPEHYYSDMQGKVDIDFGLTA